MITFGSPVDTAGALPLGIPEEVAEAAAGVLAGVFGRTAVPAWMSRTGFRLLDPVKSLRQQVDFVRQLHDREALLPRERQRRFLMGEGWVAWPGPALADFMRQFIAHNRMLAGRLRDRGPDRDAGRHRPPGADRRRRGRRDRARAGGAGDHPRRAARRGLRARRCAPGHFGLVVGSTATATTWPAVAAWTHWRAGRGRAAAERSAGSATPSRSPRRPGSGPGSGSGSSSRPGSAAGSPARSAGAASRTVGGAPGARRGGHRPAPAPGAARAAAAAHAGLARPAARRAGRARAPEADFFLFEDRAYTHEAVKRRIDNVVRGLLSLGVRQGEHVGVLMSTRPSGLSVVAALNRLGAVAVLMRPDGPVAREAELGQVTRIVADPELAGRAREAGRRGGAGARRRRRRSATSARA